MSSISDTAILAVSFGTSFNENCAVTIGATEETIRQAFPETPLIRAFTSGKIIRKIAKRDGVHINTVTEALEEALAAGAKKLVVQPTHLMDGHEYHDILEDVEPYRERFEKIAFGTPLLDSDQDFRQVMEALENDVSGLRNADTAIVYMGHGTDAQSNSVYEKLQGMLRETGREDMYIGTVEACPTLDNMVEEVSRGAYKKVVLQPLMLVAGDHANNDMAGDEEDSWKSVFESKGYEVQCVLKGIGEIPAIRDIYVKHVERALRTLAED